MYKNKFLYNRDSSDRFIKVLLDKLSRQSHEVEEHFSRLQKLSQKFGEFLKLEEKKLKILALLSYFHDIGKITIPEEVLLKPGVLNEREWELMKQHVERGYKIAVSVGKDDLLTEAILYHHEWWDGSGYPDGLAGEEIPFLARLFSIVDAYEVMLHQRSYNGKTKTKPEAIAELKQGAGSQFDPELAKIFLNILKDEFDN